VFRFQPPSHRISLSVGCASWLVSSLLAAQPLRAQSNDAVIKITNQAQYNYNTSQDGPSIGSQDTTTIQSSTGQIVNDFTGLIDPLGVITGCNGQKLADYNGYTVSLFNAAADGLNPTGLATLVQTEVPDNPSNNIPLGLRPNSNNDNPFKLDTTSTGAYNFLFNRAAGQLDVGKSYILVVKPPTNSTYAERRVRIDVTNFSNNILSYRATSLDGQPLNLTDNSTVVSSQVNVNDAATTGLNLSLLSLKGIGVSACDAKPIQIVKSADRASAEPGDTVVYRLTLRNLSDTDIINPTVTDTLPLGLFLRPESVKAQLGSTIQPVSISQNGGTTTFKVGAPGFTIPAKQVVNLVYAATLDADAIRGTGRNIASLTAIRKDNNLPVTDGPVGYQLTVRQGLIRDTGTLLGRVFVDKNFDGEQQPNEPGVPNAVVFLDDGNRITTDANGLFSVQSVATGYRTGVLDLGSLPGYTLAPNIRFIERNSLSRLVKIAPGGIVRMNFGVTPTAREAK
jgi:uncharacterized repeat protein (TIGR01451 family)